MYNKIPKISQTRDKTKEFSLNIDSLRVQINLLRIIIDSLSYSLIKSYHFSVCFVHGTHSRGNVENLSKKFYMPSPPAHTKLISNLKSVMKTMFVEGFWVSLMWKIWSVCRI